MFKFEIERGEKTYLNGCKDVKVALIKRQGDAESRAQLSSPEFTERTWIKSKSSFAHSRCRKQDVIREDKVLFVLHLVVGESLTVPPHWRQVPYVPLKKGGKKR